MPFSRSDTAELQQAQAVIRKVDLINREVELSGVAKPWVVHVPPDCEIFLRTERVKLRLLQPGDRVRLTFRADAGFAVARSIEVYFGRADSSR